MFPRSTCLYAGQRACQQKLFGNTRVRLSIVASFVTVRDEHDTINNQGVDYPIKRAEQSLRSAHECQGDVMLPRSAAIRARGVFIVQVLSYRSSSGDGCIHDGVSFRAVVLACSERHQGRPLRRSLHLSTMLPGFRSGRCCRALPVILRRDPQDLAGEGALVHPRQDALIEAVGRAIAGNDRR